MINELVTASHEARSPYLKSESFRMIAQLFILNKEDKDDEKNNQSGEVNAILKKACVPLCESLEKAFSVNELVKAKRVRDILKASERILEFTNRHGDECMWNGMSNLSEPLQTLRSTSASNSVKSICEKLEKSIKEGLEKVAKAKAEAAAAAEASSKATITPAKSTTASKAKGKKSKKKKKKGKK